MTKLILTTLIVLTSSFASANFVISPGLSYMSEDVTVTQPSSGNSEKTEVRADVRVGYILPMGLYLGGMYSHIGVNSGESTSGNLMGATVGYFSMGTGFYSLLTYHILGEMGQGSNVTLTGAQGPQVDVGWVFPVTSSFAIGPQLTWRSVEYSKLESGSTIVDTDRKQDSIAPYVSLWFMF